MATNDGLEYARSMAWERAALADGYAEEGDWKMASRVAAVASMWTAVADMSLRSNAD